MLAGCSLFGQSLLVASTVRPDPQHTVTRLNFFECHSLAATGVCSSVRSTQRFTVIQDGAGGGMWCSWWFGVCGLLFVFYLAFICGKPACVTKQLVTGRLDLLRGMYVRT